MLTGRLLSAPPAALPHRSAGRHPLLPHLPPQYFDWTHPEVTARFKVSQEHIAATGALGINWAQYQKWDLVTLTQHYMLLLTEYTKRNLMKGKEGDSMRWGLVYSDPPGPWQPCPLFSPTHTQFQSFRRRGAPRTLHFRLGPHPTVHFAPATVALGRA